MPERIQLRRVKGWRKPKGAVVVARPSKWGNPYAIAMMRQRVAHIAEFGVDVTELDPRELAVDAFRSDLLYGPDSKWWWYGPHVRMIEIRLALGELRGKDLCCWCPLRDVDGNRIPCHGDVLLEVANL